jgi:hypothetical protein
MVWGWIKLSIDGTGQVMQGKDVRKLVAVSNAIALAFAFLSMCFGVRFVGFRAGHIVIAPGPNVILSLLCAVCGLLFLYVPMRQTLLQRRQASRAALGLCPACGFDLRASRKRCPECGERIDPVTRYGALPKFFGYHFWSKWRTESADCAAVILRAVREETPDEIYLVAEQLGDFLLEGYDEAEVRTILTADFGCCYDPAEDGLSCVEWLSDVRDRLADRAGNAAAR